MTSATMIVGGYDWDYNFSVQPQTFFEKTQAANPGKKIIGGEDILDIVAAWANVQKDITGKNVYKVESADLCALCWNDYITSENTSITQPPKFGDGEHSLVCVDPALLKTIIADQKNAANVELFVEQPKAFDHIKGIEVCPSEKGNFGPYRLPPNKICACYTPAGGPK